jgi:hypothetical protein
MTLKSRITDFENDARILERMASQYEETSVGQWPPARDVQQFSGATSRPSLTPFSAFDVTTGHRSTVGVTSCSMRITGKAAGPASRPDRMESPLP